MKIEHLVFLAVSFLFACGKTIPYDTGSKWSKDGIASLEKIKLNGLSHSVLLRGTDKNNPILLHIHAMGVPSMAFAHLEYASEGAPTELMFTVVHYDQRGFGKTYIRGGRSRGKINISQYVADAEQLVEILRRRFKKEKIFVLGESFGSVIAAHLVARHPERYFALVGAGQVSDVTRYMKEVYEYNYRKAREEKNEDALDDLENPGPPTRDMSARNVFKSIMKGGEWMDKFQAEETGMEEGAGFFFRALWDAPEYSFFDFTNTLSAYKSTQKKIVKELITVNLAVQVPKIEVPVFFVMGEYDLWTEITREYFDKLEAPKKKFVVFEKAGHMVRGDKSEEFIRLMTQEVHPLSNAD